MKITNSQGLPQPFVDMAMPDYEYKPKEYRVTSMLKGVREILLTARHREEISEDVSNMMWALFGTAAHKVLERSKEGTNQLKENRLREQFGEYTLSGQFDLYDADTETITDYKTCSVWKVVKEEYEDWEKQMLMYGYMLRQIGFSVCRGEIVAIMKDHSKRDAKRERSYPQYPVRKITFEWDFRDFEKIKNFIENKFDEIRRCENVPDDDLPICEPSERWAKPESWAVKKKGKSRALRVLSSFEEALAWREENGGDDIEHRPGENRKCEEYCSCNEFCSFYKNEVKGVTQ